MLKLEESRLPGDLPLWEIPGWRARFGIAAGITGRACATGAPFDLGLRGQRPVGEVMASWDRFRAAFPPETALTSTRQVGGTEVIWHQSMVPGWTLLGEADGQITSLPGHLLLVSVADCVPIYLVAPRQRTVALLHSGWRGSAGGILRKAVGMLGQRGIEPSSLVMHAGVAIAGSSYQVGAEVLAAVGYPAPGPGPWFLDLRELLAEQALALGIRDISSSVIDTATRQRDFYSWRASRGGEGRMVAWIGCVD